jgi:hypothetical protein
MFLPNAGFLDRISSLFLFARAASVGWCREDLAAGWRRGASKREWRYNDQQGTCHEECVVTRSNILTRDFWQAETKEVAGNKGYIGDGEIIHGLLNSVCHAICAPARASPPPGPPTSRVPALTYSVACARRYFVGQKSRRKALPLSMDIETVSGLVTLFSSYWNLECIWYWGFRLWKLHFFLVFNSF